MKGKVLYCTFIVVFIFMIRPIQKKYWKDTEIIRKRLKRSTDIKKIEKRTQTSKRLKTEIMKI